MANAKYVSTGKPKVGGAIYRAPLGTELPTDAITPLPSAYKSLGYISEDGVKHNIGRTSKDIKDWGGTTVDSSQTDYTNTFGFTMIESLNIDVLKMVFGSSNVSENPTTGMITIRGNAKELEEGVYVADMLLKGNKVKRVVIPDGKISEVGEIVYKRDEAIGYAVTLANLPGEDEDSHKEYIQKIVGTECVLERFSINGNEGVIDQENGTVTVTVPHGTSVTALKAVFDISDDATAKIGTTVQVSGVTENNFTTPKTYKITAEDGTHTKEYAVTVEVAEQ